MQNSKKQFIVAALFLILAFTITVLTCLTETARSSGDAILNLVSIRTQWFKFRQILTILGIYLYGRFFLNCIVKSITDIVQRLLAFPIGIGIWCVLSWTILFLNIPYNTIFTSLGLVIILLITFFHNRKEMSQTKIGNWLIEGMFALGLACLFVSGLFFIHLTEDSYYFISQYAEILTNTEALDPSYCSFYMSSTGIAGSLVNSLAIICGFETIYGIHHMIMFSFLGIFFYSVFEICADKSKKTSILVPTIMTLLLIITPAVGITLGLELSSSYFMVYLYLYIYLMEKGQNLRVKSDYVIILAIIVCMIVLTRQEGSVLICFFAISLSALNYSNSEICHMSLWPCFIMQGTYLLKLILITGIGSDKYVLMNWTSFSSILAANILAVIYVVFIRKRKFLCVQKHLHISIFVGLCSALVILAIVFPDKMQANLSAELHNIVDEYWGYSFWMVLLMLLYKVMSDGTIGHLNTLWINYLLFYFVLCAGRTYNLREGITDSYARMMVSSIPIAYYSFAPKLLNMKSCKEKT